MICSELQWSSIESFIKFLTRRFLNDVGNFNLFIIYFTLQYLWFNFQTKLSKRFLIPWMKQRKLLQNIERLILWLISFLVIANKKQKSWNKKLMGLWISYQKWLIEQIKFVQTDMLQTKKVFKNASKGEITSLIMNFRYHFIVDHQRCHIMVFPVWRLGIVSSNVIKR